MRFPISLLALLLAGAPAFPQTVTGSISGSVVDSSGSAVPAVQLKLINAATGAERIAASNELGDFVFSGIQPGEYRITASMKGFKTLERRGVFLTAAERLPVGNLMLEVGAIAEQITVTAQGAVVQTASGERSDVLTSSQVDHLLVRGRNVTSLLDLLPGVVDPAVNQSDVPTGTGASSYHVSGNRNTSNNLSIDGMAINQVGGAPNVSTAVPMESVAEVKILTSNYQAEHGRLAGSNIQVVTKSGTREFHGGVSYFKRHEQFNATNFFTNMLGTRPTRYRYNTWGHSLSGPVYVPGRFNRDRNKLFVSWTYEYWPQKSAAAPATATVPSALERTGNFSQSLDVNGALIPIKDPLAPGQFFPGNTVPAGRIDRNGQSMLNVFPTPNFLDTVISKRAYNHVVQWETATATHMMVLKTEYLMRPSDIFTITATRFPSTVSGPNQGLLTAAFPLVQAGESRSTSVVLVGRWQHIFSPTLINEATFGFRQNFLRTAIPAEAMKAVQRSTYGFQAGQLNPDANPLNLIPSLSFGGITGAAGVSFDGRFPLENGQGGKAITDVLSKTAGSHTLKAGFNIDLLWETGGPNATHFNGTVDFSRNIDNSLDSNHPYSNAVLGNFNTYTEATSRPIALDYSNAVEWFLQDNWRATRRLTLDYGIRFSWFQPWWIRNNLASTFVPERWDPARQVRLITPALRGTQRVGVNPVTGAVYPAALIGAIAPGTGDPANGMVLARDDKSYPRALQDGAGILTAPRFGFAFDPFGNGKTAIRGGFGMFWDRPLDRFGVYVRQFPQLQTPVVQYGTLNTFLAAQGYSTPASVFAMERSMKNPLIMNMSLAVQRSVGFGTVVEVGYVGSLGRHLSWSRDLQAIPIGARFLPQNADPANPRVPIADVFLRPRIGYSGITYEECAASSNYHSLQASTRRRFARSIEFGASWTWSKAMDFVDAAWGAVTTLAPVRVWNYGLAGFDRTHALKANWLYSLPKPRKGPLPVQAALGNWQVSGIAKFQSGAPLAMAFSTATATDLTGTPSIASRIVLLSDPRLERGERTFARNFRTDAFAPPAVGTLGNAAKYSLRGPGINNWDLALFKAFRLYERLRFQFRAEAYNVFNHTQFSAWNTAARFDARGGQINQQLGQATAARNARQMQFSLRLQF